MDWNTLSQGFFTTASPLLPNEALLHFGLIVAWAVVMGALGVWMSRRWPRPHRLAWVGLLMSLTLMPGSWAPDYWLGLAFQAPSFVSVLICLYWILDMLVSRHDNAGVLALSPSQVRALHLLALAGIALGWLLLLDTLALLPYSIYSWGFSVAAIAGMSLLGVLPWVVWPQSPGARLVSLLSLLVLTLHVLTRLPDGNLWDALIDPLLWVALQLMLLGRIGRSLRAKWRASRAIRA